MANRKQRKPFTDITGKPLKAEDVAMACRVIVQTGIATPIQINRVAKLGIGRAGRILRLLEKAGVVSAKNEDSKRTIILRSEPGAINAALRTLNKGNK